MSPFAIYQLWAGYDRLFRTKDDRPYGLDFHQNYDMLMCKRALVHLDDASNRWEPAGISEAIIVPVQPYRDAPMVDLVAIDRLTDRAYTLTGDVICLGEHLLDTYEPTRLLWCDKPMEWLRAQGLGVCALSDITYDMALGNNDLTLVASSVEAGRRLRADMQAARPSVPEIAVRRDAVRGAA